MPPVRHWITRGFDDFRRGTFGNAGQNLYVSRAGVLQRIHQYDFDGDGRFDLVFCNSQNHGEKAPTYVYLDPLGAASRIELPSDGARTGVMADLNGDGHDDLVLGMWYNGVRTELNAFIYYGSPDGFSERRHQQLPAPGCSSVAAGDFDGDGRPDLAFLCRGQVRLFLQTDLGFERRRYSDLSIHGAQLAAHDLDGDGFADLVVRGDDGDVRIYWGAGDGLDPERLTTLPMDPEPARDVGSDARYAEYVEDAEPLVQVLVIAGTPHLFVARRAEALLFPISRIRPIGRIRPIRLPCVAPMAAAVGDVNGDGIAELVIACREPDGDGECSWIFWGSADGFDDGRRTRLTSRRACDVALGDLDGDGRDEIVLCQSHTADSFTADCLIYRGGRWGEPVRLQAEDARRVLLTRGAADHVLQVVFVNHFSRNLIGDIPISIYFAGADGFAPERRRDLPAWGAVEALCCDVDDDGRVDLVLANAAENAVSRDPGSYLYLNGPDGFADRPDAILPTTRAHGVCCADLNRDGYLDLIFCGFNNPDLVIFYGGPDGFDTARPHRIRMERDGVLYDDPRWIHLADLNGDGWLDLVVPQIEADRSFILWGGPDGFSMERCRMLAVIRGACARTADLTGDGTLDLVIGGHMPSVTGPHDSFAYVYWNGPDGLREDRRTLLPANTINAMSIADFDGDGRLDLFICSYHDGKLRDIDAYIYWNRDGVGFTAADRARLFTHSSSGCVAADFDEDGRVDLAIAYHKVHGDHLGHSAVWWNGPDGFDERRVTRLPTAGPHGMTAVEPGNQLDRGPEEHYTSAPFQLPDGASVLSIAWEATLTPKSWVRAQLRTAATEAALSEARWRGPSEQAAWFENDAAIDGARFTGRWVQYRLALGATNSCGTPRVTEVRVAFASSSEAGAESFRPFPM